MTVARTTAAELAAADLDVLVVGGGIVGAGVALDAVTRGLRVGLVDAGDWGGGRSGRTSTLVHGGLVDLRRIGVPAVAALRRERDLLLDRTAPHLVRRVPLLVPLTGGPVERLAVGAGLSLYDAAAFSIRQPRVLPGHRQLPRRAVPRLAPSVAMDGVTGAVQLYEAQVDDARLTIAVVRTAMAYGTLALARTPVRRLVTDAGPASGTTVDGFGRVTGAVLEDPVRGPVTVRARVVVLATGTELSQLLPGAAGGRSPSPTQPPVTVHLVLPRSRLRASTGLVLREGDRAVYVVPWGRHWIVGTTAAWSEPDRLLAALNAHLARPIAADAVESTFAGPAPLGPDGGRTPTVQVPVPGAGAGPGQRAGRLPRRRRACGRCGRRPDRRSPPALHHLRVPLLGADGFTARWNQRHLLARRAGVHVVVLEHLLQRYGSEVDVLIEAIQRRPELGRPLPGAADYLAVEVWFGVVHEGATQLRDVLARRTRIAMETWDGGAEAAAGVAELMAAELGWDDAERSRQISSYLRRAAADR